MRFFLNVCKLKCIGPYNCVYFQHLKKNPSLSNQSCFASAHQCENELLLSKSRYCTCESACVSTTRGSLIRAGPSPGRCCLWGNGLLLGPSLIGSIQTLSSLMGLFAALLWTQTHLQPPAPGPGRRSQETHVPTRWCSDHLISPLVSTVIFIVFLADKTQ